MIYPSYYCRIRLLSKDASQEKLYTIPAYAKQIELVLYREAVSFDAYVEMSTLRHRIRKLEECNDAGEAGITSTNGEMRHRIP